MRMFADLWPPKEEAPTIITLFIGRSFWKMDLKYILTINVIGGYSYSVDSPSA